MAAFPGIEAVSWDRSPGGAPLFFFFLAVFFGEGWGGGDRSEVGK